MITESFDAPDTGVTILVWASNPATLAALESAARGEGRTIVPVADGDMAGVANRGDADLLLAEDADHLRVQSAFLRLPLVLVERAGTAPDERLTRRAYAVVHRPSEVGLAIDRFLEHRSLATRAASRREPPRRCSRCGRGYDPAAGRKGPARRFVRFGGVSLCGGCVEKLRGLLAGADAPYVEAEA